jgi:hypothetical protein
MTDRNFGGNLFWIAEVVNVYDPDQSGRVQIRIFGRFDDDQNIPDDDLPWALPLQPITSAAYGKLGTAPLGLVKGSKVMGLWMDADQQYPIILGSMGKAGDPMEDGADTDGIPEIDITTGSIPGPAINQSDPVPNNPYSKLYTARITIDAINKAGGFKEIAKYIPAVGVINMRQVDNLLKEPKKPTSASADKSDTSDILDIMKVIDPNKLSRVLPGAGDGFNAVKGIMSLTSPKGTRSMSQGGIQGLAGIMSGKMNLNGFMGPLTALTKTGILPPDIQKALKSALVVVAAVSKKNGGRYTSHGVSYVVPKHNSAIGSPPANLMVANPPDTYVQQYYALDKEPYPGYIEWKDSTGTAKVYTLRNGQPHYATPHEHIQANATLNLELTMGSVLLKNAIKNNGQFTTAMTQGDITKIASALTNSHNNVVADGIKKVLGNNIDLKNIIKLASKFIPQMAGALNSISSGHLPKSVLSSSAGDSINKFAQNQSRLAMKKKEMKASTEPETSEQQDAQIQAYQADQEKQAKDLAAYNAMQAAHAARPAATTQDTGTNVPTTTTLA